MLLFELKSPSFPDMPTCSTCETAGYLVIYLINGILKYNAYDGTLYLTDGSADMLTLSRIANELLCLMVSNNNCLLNREEVLNELWNKRGLNASNNNLNNYISMLRKALANCGFTDLISTIPRHGFIFSADIEILSEEPQDSDAYLLRRSERAESATLNHKIKSRLFFWLDRRINVFTAILLFFVTLFVYFMIKEEGTEKKHKAFEIDKCNVYLMDSGSSDKNADDEASVIKKILIENKLSCGRNADVFYFKNKSGLITDSAMKKGVLAYCADGSESLCTNYGLFKHEE